MKVVDEIGECYHKYGIREIDIFDYDFTINKKRTITICREMRKRGLDILWACRSRVDIDRELLQEMSKAGCGRIYYGIESGSQETLDRVKKGITLEQIEKAFKITKKIGIQTVGYFMIGSPSEKKEDILQTIKFAKKLNPDFIHISVTTPFPATGLYYLGLEKKILPYDYWQEFAKNPNPKFIPCAWEENLTKKQLFCLLKHAYRSFYFRPNYILKKISKLTSWQELKNKARAAFKLLKV